MTPDTIERADAIRSSPVLVLLPVHIVSSRAATIVVPLAAVLVTDRAGLFVGLALVPAVAAMLLPGLLLLLPRRTDQSAPGTSS